MTASKTTSNSATLNSSAPRVHKAQRHLATARTRDAETRREAVEAAIISSASRNQIRMHQIYFEHGALAARWDGALADSVALGESLAISGGVRLDSGRVAGVRVVAVPPRAAMPVGSFWAQPSIAVISLSLLTPAWHQLVHLAT